MTQSTEARSRCARCFGWYPLHQLRDASAVWPKVVDASRATLPRYQRIIWLICVDCIETLRHQQTQARQA
jgi:hypothetical protein